MDPFAMGSALTQRGGLPQLIWRSQANLTVLSRSLAWIKREPQGCPGRKSVSEKDIYSSVWLRCRAKLPRGLPLEYPWMKGCLTPGDGFPAELLDGG